MTEEGALERMRRTEAVTTSPINRTGVEGLLFAGSSIPTSDPQKPYDIVQLRMDLGAGKVPNFLFSLLREIPLTEEPLREVNADRDKGVKGVLPCFTNNNVEINLPHLNESGRIDPEEWQVKAGIDGQEAPVLDEQYTGILDLAQNSRGEWIFTLKGKK